MGEPRDELAAIRGEKNCSPARGDEGNHQPDSLGDPEKLLRREVRGYLAQAFLPSIQRIGYFNIDSESTPRQLGIQPYRGLKDTWSKD